MAWVWPNTPVSSPRGKRSRDVLSLSKQNDIKTEHQQVHQYYYNNSPPISYAPFGNEYTPLVKNKIVAGRLQPVLERRINPQGGVSPRSYYPHVVEPIAPKPNQVDPQLLKDYTQKLQSVNREFETISKPTTYGKRPDSKDLGNRYVNLPPIDQNKSRMEKSTIFEPESWTNYYRKMRERELAQQQQDGRYNANDVSNGFQNSGYGANGVTNGSQSPVLFDPPEQQQQQPPMLHQMRDYHSEPPKRVFTKEDEERFRLKEMVRMLPQEPDLPEHPVNLTMDEQEFLLMATRKELGQSDSNRLKEVYFDITENYDRTLSGWCHYSNLFKSMADTQFRMSSDLQRMIASMFVSSSHLQEVNYEKFISFVGSALRDSQGNSWPVELYSPRPGLEAQGQTNQYYRSQNDTHRSQQTRPASPPFERDVTKLMKMTEQQLDESDIDFEALVLRFQRYDREMRETLSADQIKGVLIKSGIGLQDSVINKILDKCGTTDGQYNWLKFVDFLEKTGQKAKTGLPIPRSKRPLEYAKQVPSPVPQWPHAATNEHILEPVAPLWKNDERGSPEYFQRPLYDPNEESELTENKKMIDKMDRQLRNLETEYEDMKHKLRSPRSDSLWFKYFMTFADELYAQDKRNSGYLPEQEVINYTHSANNSYNLGIPDSAILDNIRDTSSHGRVNVHNYLTRLGQRNW